MATDLYCHTRMSDGTVSIDELVTLAKIKGIDTIAITDRDTSVGTTRAKIFGDRQGVEITPGIGVSAYDNARGRKVHTLGYDCENPDRLEGLCKRIDESHKQAVNIMTQKVMRLYPIPAEMTLRRAQGHMNIYKQHIIYALADVGHTTEMFDSVFHKLFDPRGGLVYCAAGYADMHDVIRQAHEAGDVAVIAHPSQHDGYDSMLKLTDRGEIDGTEAQHPLHKEENVPQYIALARLRDLLMVGGSDLHGVHTSYSRVLGVFATPSEQLEALKKENRRIESGG